MKRLMRSAAFVILTIVFLTIVGFAIRWSFTRGTSNGPPRPDDPASLSPALRKLIDENLAAVEAAPDDDARWAKLGMVYEANGFIDQAGECYGHGVSLQPDKPQWLYLHALVKAKRGDVREALAEMKRIVQMQPDFGPAFIRMGLWHLDLGEFADADRDFEWANRLAPDDPVVLQCQAELDLATGRERDIPNILGDRVAQQPADLFSRYLLGTAYVRLGELDKGNELLKGASDKRPEWHDEWDYRISQYRVKPPGP